jgi:aspartyl protease family protein
MNPLAARLERAGYGRGAANALTQFVDQCRWLDGFLNATVNDLMAVSDFSAVVKIADRLVETDNTTPQHYFMRGHAREGAHD